jgi:hypothetical protein
MVFFDAFEETSIPSHKINKIRRRIFVNTNESKMTFQKCVCGSNETEIKVTEPAQLVICSNCDRISVQKSNDQMSTLKTVTSPSDK